MSIFVFGFYLLYRIDENPFPGAIGDWTGNHANLNRYVFFAMIPIFFAGFYCQSRMQRILKQNKNNFSYVTSFDYFKDQQIPMLLSVSFAIVVTEFLGRIL